MPAGLRVLIAFAALSGSLWLAPGSAHAYRNPARFVAPAEDGGGGEKFFTASRAEGYGCGVCHTSGEPVALEVRGLPVDGYLPGQSYAVTIDWPDAMRSVALNVELTDYDGNPVGDILRPDPGTLGAADLCKESDAPSTGQELPTIPSGRRVLTVAECGQQQTTFLWRAPLIPTRGYLGASLVFSNRDSKLGGDRVVDISRAFGPSGQPAPQVDNYAASCSVAPTRSPHGTPWITLPLLFVVLRRRQRSNTVDHNNAGDACLHSS
jgi:hypothetical protein